MRLKQTVWKAPIAASAEFVTHPEADSIAEDGSTEVNRADTSAVEPTPGSVRNLNVAQRPQTRRTAPWAALVVSIA